MFFSETQCTFGQDVLGQPKFSTCFRSLKALYRLLGYRPTSVRFTTEPNVVRRAYIQSCRIWVINRLGEQTVIENECQAKRHDFRLVYILCGYRSINYSTATAPAMLTASDL